MFNSWSFSPIISLNSGGAKIHLHLQSGEYEEELKNIYAETDDFDLGRFSFLWYLYFKHSG